MKIKTISIVIVISVLTAVILYAGMLLWFTWPISELSLDRSGLFGDSFGLLTSLFSGLAFSGMLIAVLLQREELGLQRNELELTRKELQGQKQEMRLQNKTLLKQSFENTFFQLLSLQQDIVGTIDLHHYGNKHTTKGRDCFRVFYQRFIEEYNEINPIGVISEEAGLTIINQSYSIFYMNNQAKIGHYFRSIYNIIKFIHCNESVADKRLYTNLLRAQLSANELTLILYNCLSDFGNKKFKPLVEEYALLKNLSQDGLISKENHIKYYENSAFGNKT